MKNAIKWTGPKKLTAHQQKVVEAFDTKNTDIDIVTIYTRVYGDAGELMARDCQQKLAPTFAEINSRCHDIHIEPGEKKRTYRCSTPPRKG